MYSRPSTAKPNLYQTQSTYFTQDKKHTAPFFKQTKVGSCNKVVIRNGVPIAICYPIWNRKGQALNNYKNIPGRKPENILDQAASENSADEMPEINTENLDEVLSLAKENNLSLRGHCLVWHNQTPEWFFCEKYDAGNDRVDKNTMKKRMESYIKKVLTYCQKNYPGVIYAWDVFSWFF